MDERVDKLVQEICKILSPCDKFRAEELRSDIHIAIIQATKDWR